MGRIAGFTAGSWASLHQQKALINSGCSTFLMFAWASCEVVEYSLCSKEWLGSSWFSRSRQQTTQVPSMPRLQKWLGTSASDRTVIWQPSKVVPFKSRMARRAVSSQSKSTFPVPLELPLSSKRKAPSVAKSEVWIGGFGVEPLTIYTTKPKGKAALKITQPKESKASHGGRLKTQDRHCNKLSGHSANQHMQRRRAS